MVDIKLKNEDIKNLENFCTLNNLNVEEFAYICFRKGFDLERYGLLNEPKEQIVLVDNCVDKESELELIRSKLSNCENKRLMLEETLLTLKAEIKILNKND